MEARLADSPEARAQVEFERGLRARVSEVMKSSAPAAPEELADLIRSALNQAEDEQVAEPPVPVVAGRIDPTAQTRPAAATPRWRWVLPQRANAVAIAATLVIIAGVIIVSILLPPIGPSPQDQTPQIAVSLIGKAVEYVAEHHGKCAHDEEYLNREGPYQSPAEAKEKLSTYLGHEVTIFDFSDLADASYRFAGGGECAVPGAEPSCHLIYRRDPSERDERTAPYIASVFIERNRGQFDLTERAFEYGSKACGPEGKHEVRYFPAGDLVYFIIACDVEDMPAITESAIRQLQAAGSAR
ncbi:MAG: hypothetical protein JSV91_02650 [Phycisphaerales bacterium]|nr:MAG: hypothetical protein JSV91_02650 [Phycisphaerales bacterium]